MADKDNETPKDAEREAFDKDVLERRDRLKQAFTNLHLSDDAPTMAALCMIWVEYAVKRVRLMTALRIMLTIWETTEVSSGGNFASLLREMFKKAAEKSEGEPPVEHQQADTDVITENLIHLKEEDLEVMLTQEQFARLSREKMIRHCETCGCYHAAETINVAQLREALADVKPN